MTVIDGNEELLMLKVGTSVFAGFLTDDAKAVSFGIHGCACAIKWQNLNDWRPLLLPFLQFQKASEDDKIVLCSLDNGSGKCCFCAIDK
jgi:hypothetical protein